MPPANNQRAQGMALTLNGVRLQKAADGIYFVTGSPATAVLLGLSNVYDENPPDLVISGINDGANIGSGTVLSGTVGAAVAASRVAAQAPMPFASLLYPPTQDGSYELKFQRTPMRRNSGVDTYFFGQGMITITPLAGDFAAHGKQKSLLIQLRGLAP